jgi:hypothetical protein
MGNLSDCFAGASQPPCEHLLLDILRQLSEVLTDVRAHYCHWMVELPKDLFGTNTV